MLNPMPVKPLGSAIKPQISTFNLENFFGFMEVVILCPDSVINPILPFKAQGRTIFPKGLIKGVYFLEEIKNAIRYGYKLISINRAQAYSKELIFNDYVKEMFNIKANSTGPLRFIAKLLLNSLYGIFGRKQELLRTIVVNNDNLDLYHSTYNVRSVMPIDEYRSTILIEGNISKQIANKLEMSEEVFNSFEYPVKANVAIASAITSYARIHMSHFKQNQFIMYTDTDSIITTQPLPKEMLGTDIGMFADELNGSIIEEIYILGIKQYGYWYTDSNGQRIERSVWAGIPRNSLTFNEIESIARGNVLHKTVDGRFFKSLVEMNIQIKPTN